jgi:hypothetical protein
MSKLFHPFIDRISLARIARIVRDFGQSPAAEFVLLLADEVPIMFVDVLPATKIVGCLCREPWICVDLVSGAFLA